MACVIGCTDLIEPLLELKLSSYAFATFKFFDLIEPLLELKHRIYIKNLCFRAGLNRTTFGIETRNSQPQEVQQMRT